ncbi:MAG: LURP-one-related family protein [Clostridiales bacterium]|nr:LURP-one-related family protein [Clostridiales bacterium]
MILFIKQSALSWSDKFAIKDESGEDRWIAQGDVLSFAHFLRVYDLSGKERATIKEKWTSFFPKHVVQAGFESFEIVKEFSMFSQRYDISGIGWSVAGDFLAHDYTIEGEGQVIAHMTKECLSWGDSYRLDIISQRDELPALCVALAIDCTNHD